MTTGLCSLIKLIIAPLLFLIDEPGAIKSISLPLIPDLTVSNAFVSLTFTDSICQ